MRIGLSLPWEYLCGLDGAAQAEPFRSAFGAARRALDILRGLGVTSIELRQLTPEVPPARAVEAVERVLGSGMDATVHAWLAEPDGGEAPDASYPWLAPAAALLAGRRDGLLVVVHAFHSASGREEELEERTVGALRRVDRFLEIRRLAVRFALELNRNKGRIDPSTSFRGVARMWARIGRPGVGICWDWGHGYANGLAGRTGEDPGPDFLRGVVHTHVHGLGPAGGTHWPLTGGRVPLARYLALLRGAGYTGIYNLELSPGKFAPPETTDRGAAVRAAVEGSIELLRNGGQS